MNYDIPALEAKNKAERKLMKELEVFCSKIKRVETQMNKALRIIETAQKTFDRMDAGQKTLSGMDLPFMTHEYNTVATVVLQ